MNSFYCVFSQVIQTDSIVPIEIKEIIVIGKKDQVFEKQSKPLTSIDDYLQKSPKVDMIKRGAYAWEPIINSMPTERTLITIDGMRIFGACTDKMDPITSYIEVSNLSEATICSGQEGACFGSTIGGSIDLKRNQSTFGNQKWDFSLNSGFETNNKQKIIGTAFNYSDKLFYVNTDVMFRDAENYKAGGNQEILFSQFKKFNFSGTTGFKLNANKRVEASFIYDKATNIGYPALPMDVAVAEAIITSLRLDYLPKLSTVKKWETKLYFNTINHKMDDTKRPFVAIHMDMPGWSKTYGYYSKINGDYKNHSFIVNANSFYNKSVAEMTMYPNNPNENPMFMFTWPDVSTFYNGLFIEDNYTLNCHSNLKISVSLGSHSNKVESQFGLESLQIFYPNMKAQNNRFLKSFASNYNYNLQGFEYGYGFGYGERAPSVSEGYGFYLFNSFVGFDNIGNPNLKNENSIEGNAFIGFKTKNGSAKIASSYFHISNYIVAKPSIDLVPMTIGANGVKIYSALDYATIFNISLVTEYNFSKLLKWNSQLVYSRGKDIENVNLPFISPFSYLSSFVFSKGVFSADFSVQGNANQDKFSAIYGEDKTPDYAILNTSFGYKFLFSKSKLAMKLGFENILDTYYSTYSDWNNFPRQGRNIFCNLNYSL